MNRVVQRIGFLLCIPSLLFAQGSKVISLIQPGGKVVKLPIVRIAAQPYIAAADAVRLLPGSSIAEQREFYSQQHQLVIRFFPYSLVLHIFKQGGEYAYQMPYPVIRRERTVLLPLLPFLDALQTIGVLQYTAHGNEIRVVYQQGPIALLPLVPKQQQWEEPVVVTGAINPFDKGVAAVRQRLAWMDNTGATQYLREERGWYLTASSSRRKGMPVYKRAPQFLPPVFYQLPPGLRRPLPKLPVPKTRSSNEQLPMRSSPLLASLVPLEWLNSPERERSRPPLLIQRIRIVRKADSYELYLYANRRIPAYQKPEFAGRTVTIRIPGALHRAGSLESLARQAQCQIRVEKIRNILRYTFHFPAEISDVDYRRIAKSTGLKFRVYLKTEVRSVAEKLQKEQQKWHLDVIVLDPGHGGKDAGAIGVTGVREKDVVLAIALEVGRLLRKELPGVKVVYTRETDRFVELYRRGQIANEKGGKLFISIHCNSKPKKPDPTRGCETYILRPGRNAEAIEVAQRENAVIQLEADQQRYQKLTEEQIIIATMAQRAFVRFSELFAALLQRHVSQRTGLPDRGVRQAGFFVLVGASMPNVLFEAGFLSNPQDERFLASKAGQRKIARGIVDAIKAYVRQYEKMLAVEQQK